MFDVEKTLIVVDDSRKANLYVAVINEEELRIAAKKIIMQNHEGGTIVVNIFNIDYKVCWVECEVLFKGSLSGSQLEEVYFYKPNHEEVVNEDWILFKDWNKLEYKWE